MEALASTAVHAIARRKSNMMNPWCMHGSQEHLAFKGTKIVGTKDAAKEATLLEQLDDGWFPHLLSSLLGPFLHNCQCVPWHVLGFQSLSVSLKVPLPHHLSIITSFCGMMLRNLLAWWFLTQTLFVALLVQEFNFFPEQQENASLCVLQQIISLKLNHVPTLSFFWRKEGRKEGSTLVRAR
jgi:hypothetical protein